MNLCKCSPATYLRSKLYVQCIQCGRQFEIGKMWADLDGVPFKDYYCNDCKEE